MRRSVVVGLLVAVLVALGVVNVSPAAAAATTVGQRSGFAPTSRLLLWGTDAELARDLDLMASTGARWLRFDFDWASAETSPGRYNWTFIDRVVNQAQRRGLQVLATPAYTPAWARPAGTTDKTPPTDPATFARFVGAAAARYAPLGVHHWEVWNEPNIIHFWEPTPNPEAYARLLVAASVAIRSADPAAVIVSAGLAPAGDSSDGRYISPRTFLGRVYDAGAGPAFDAVGMHPYAFPYGVDAVGDWNQFQSMPKTYALMASRGDSAKKIWATEFGAPTGANSQAVSEAGQAQMISSGWAKWTSWSFSGPIFWYAARDVGTDPQNVEDNFGLVRKDFGAKTSLGEFTRVMAQPDVNGSAAVSSPAPTPATTPAATPGSAGTPGGSQVAILSSAPGAPAPSAASGRRGYWMVTTAGDVLAFGDAAHYGQARISRGAVAVDIESSPGGTGYWVVDDRGAVAAFGSARHFGDRPALGSGERVTSMSATHGSGYWLFTSWGRVLPYGDAPFFGDLAGTRLNAPVLDSATTPTDGGYYLVGADGGIFTFGDAVFAGSTGNLRLNAPVQSLVPDSDGRGYWLVASDGGIFAFDAPFYGSMGGTRLNRPVSGMVGDAAGYLMVGEDGGIFTFAGARFQGSAGANPPAAPVTSVAVLG